MLSLEDKERGIVESLREASTLRLERENLRLSVQNIKKKEKEITREIAELSAGEIAVKHDVSVNAVLVINARHFK
jgi:regulator of replication initiation timing